MPWHPHLKLVAPTRSVKPKLSLAKAAAVGAVLALIAVIASRALGSSPPDNNTISFAVGYWGGAAIGGAMFGVAVAAFKNRER